MRIKGHYTQVTAITDNDGNVYSYPDYILCAHLNCIMKVSEAKKTFSVLHQREVLVCPECLPKVLEINTSISETLKEQEK